MRKPRLNVHVRAETFRRLEQATARPGTSKAAVVDAALSHFLSPERDDERDAAIVRRLDALERASERLERDLAVASETLMVFVRYFLTVTRPLTEADQDAARALGQARFDQFLQQVAKRVAHRKRLGDVVLERVRPTAADFFTAADLGAEHDTDGEDGGTAAEAEEGVP